MNGSCLEFKNPIQDAISRVRFAPQSNNLLISSWDPCLRLYDVDCSQLRLEAPSEAALLDSCFQEESVAFSAASDGSITRYDLHSGISNKIGNHDDIATCVEYSTETRQVITAGFDKKIIAWDIFGAKPLVYLRNLDAEVESMSLSGYELIIAVGSSVDIYDLRNSDKCVQSNKFCMDVPIRCVSSIPYLKGYAVGSVDGRVKLEISYPYMFRCHPRSRDGRNHLVPVNDIAFNPFISGAFVTGDNVGYVTAWDAKSRRRLFELPGCANSIASLTYNNEGQILAVASSHTYQEATEIFELILGPKEAHVETSQAEYQLHALTNSFTLLTLPRFPTSKLCFDPYLSLSPKTCELFSFVAMSDEDHHFESKADAGASKTFPQQAGTIRKNGHIVIKSRPCKVVEVSTSKTGKHGHAKCHFVGIDIFTGKKVEDIVPSSHNCDVPHVNRTDYQLIDISEDGFVSLLTESGNTKDDLRLPTDEFLLTQIKTGFAEGKDLIVTVMSAMGEEQICALKDIGPK
ncbi:mitotic checkpoint protein BUB3.3-like [Gossypium australe]|uniref:Mitotic checkpoint protein BUB3.3-like n=1 Tax=Gossypium australe TaxID=47621 RepID=A0A5B6UZL3_9ROSI|nr:mitotic checkpoint protein BUB3.3-like [Gossypium australe]